MSSEIEVPETPNWLKDLEEKRERRLKARLGHEAGAGAPCLKCEDKCPGLDLHFWRKACKICRCPKEEHDVPDDDVYGWAQFQLLGSKPSKVKTKIVLPGKKDEVELEWAPKGHKETIDKYLKTLPPESLPVKGSQAAQERKQLLQKQIPVHDIDPSLCHELNEEEVKKMEDYIDHVKKSSVGVGQIVNLSSVIKANLHNISPQEAHIIASRYSKGIPFSELVKLQAGLAKNLENLTLNSPKKTPLKEMQPVNPIQQETLQNPLHASKFKDITQPWYSNTSPGKGTTSAQYSENVQRQQKPDYAIDKKLLQGTNFDPSKTPSQFLGYHTPGYRPKDQYGFENPYFNQPKYEEQNPQAPKSVKDLIYSTYDPDKGPVPQDEGSSRSFNPKDSGYNSNLVPNTYKHDPSVFQSMPMDPAKTIPQGIPRFDPLTGKLIKEDHRYPQKISSGPHLPRFDPETGKYIKEDLKYPQNIAGGAIFDPVTGKYLAERLEGTKGALSRVDPITGKLIPGYQSAQMPRYDPKTGKYIEEDARYPQNIAGGAIYDPITGNYLAETREGPGGALSMIDPVTGKLSSGYQSMPRYDPETGKYIEGGSYYPGNMEGGKVIDPVTGQPIPGHHIGQTSRYDPETGKYIEEGSKDSGNIEGGRIIDPVTGQPLSGNHIGKTLRYDPESGKYIEEGAKYSGNIKGGRIIDPVTGEPIPGHHVGQMPRYDPETGKYIEGGSNYPGNMEGGRVFDPVTGQPIPGHHVGQMPRYDPETGKYIEGGSNYPGNMEGGRVFDPVPGHHVGQMPRYDPETGKYIEGGSNYPVNMEGGSVIDPVTGQPIPGHHVGQMPRYDPETGKYIEGGSNYPGNMEGGKVIDPVTGQPIPGHHVGQMPRYDSETGKYIEGGSNYPENMEGGKVIDPVTGQPIPGHHVGQMPRYDPETGKYIRGGSNYPGNMKGGRVIDPVTGQPIPGHHVGQMSRYDPKTGKYIQEDPRYPKNILGRTIFDPVTGKYLPDTGAGEYDPITGKPIPGHHFNQLPRFDPETGKYIEDDPRYQQRLADSRVFDPITGKYLSDNERGAELDPITGKPRFDPESGKYLADPKSQEVAKPYNPNTSQYITDDVPLFDPVTGKYIPEDQRLPNSDSKKPSVLESIRRFENAMSPKGLNKLRKPLSDLQPGQINVSEDYLEPHMVNIGAIQDINPEIRAATTKLNPGFEDQNEDNNADYSPDSIREILNNIKLPDCHYCKKPFEENEFAVTIDRANVLFHAQCFKCAGCNQSLADNIYFYYKDTNNVYCGRDYAKIMGYPRCSACDELIFTKEYCLAENSTFHLKHFCCFQCDTPLAGQDYTLEDEKPYCLPCFETSKAAKCSTCENVIKPDEIGCQLNGVHFHAEDRCFRCIVCSVPLMGKKMLLRNEKLYCSHECFNTGKK